MTGLIDIPILAPIASADELDVAGYLAANPDLAGSALTPRTHYAQFGRAEGRRQVPIARIVAARAAKLARVRFVRDPVPGVLSVDDAGLAAGEAATPCAPDLAALALARPGGLFLDAGADLRDRVFGNVVTTGATQSLTTDLVCAVETLPFADAQFDGVACARLARSAAPWRAVHELLRVLKPGGIALIDWPMIRLADPADVPGSDIARLIEPDCEILSADVGLAQHPAVPLVQLLAAWRDALPAADAETFEAMTVADLLARDPLALAAAPVGTALPRATRARLAAAITITARKRL